MELLAASTINRRMSAISAVLTHVMDELEWLNQNPARIRALTENNERSDEEALLPHALMRRLLQATRNSTEPCLYAFAITAMLSGARTGELQGLRWKDVDLDRDVANHHETC